MTQKQIQSKNSYSKFLLRFAFAKSRIPLTLQTLIYQSPQIRQIQKIHTKPKSPKISQTPRHTQINFTFPRTRAFHAIKIAPKSPKFFQRIKVFLRVKSLKFAPESTFLKGMIHYDPIL